MSEEKPFMSVRTFANGYRIGLPQAYAAAHKGEIPAIRIGKRLWIVREALEKKLLKSAISTTQTSSSRQSTQEGGCM